ncbi:MAG: ThiF family adenylyltransferase, partial [Pseudomonadota bacterium]
MERTVLVVGAGGLGCAVLPLLAAHGLRIRVYDADVVSLDNLQRQLLFRTADVGRPKVEAAADALARLFPGA